MEAKEVLRSGIALCLDRTRRPRRKLLDFVQAHRVLLLCCLGSYLLIQLSCTAVLWTAPVRQSQKHARSYQEAGKVSDHLQELGLDQYLVRDLRAAVQKALSPEFGAWRVQGGQEEPGDNDPLVKSVESLVNQLWAVEKRVPCHWDPTLEADLHRLEGGKYLIAANFRNNEQLLPHVIVQLWHLLAILPPGSAFVSVYESGSHDSTGAWLEILSHVLETMQVHYRVIAGGNLTRAKGQDRIDFLAQVRNAALEPLWEPVVELTSGDASYGEPLPGLKQPWEADKVIFVNDVYFCARDAVRLLLHDADMSCGMDFVRESVTVKPAQEQRYQLGLFLHHKLGLPAFVGYLLGLISGVLEVHARSETADKFYRHDKRLMFYDIWVARDSGGEVFSKFPPFGSDPYTLQRLPAGLPFPVKCCWNGMVALNAAPFTRHNLRVRAHQEGECAASECTLVCNDFSRLGYRSLVLDPGVRQAYTIQDALDLYQPQWVQDINASSWAEVTRAPGIDWSLTPFRPFSQCCPLLPGTDNVDMINGCDWENFVSTNFTALALESSRTEDVVAAFNATRDDKRRRALKRRKAAGANVWEN